MLAKLIEQSTADWVALIDAGAIWNPELLVAALPLMRDSSVMGLAPSYMPVNSGLLERMVWRLERILKRMENLAGGTVSVHGLSVLYRRSNLNGAFATLQSKTWFNDDIVIPLTLRLRYPDQRIVFMPGDAQGAWVRDIGVVKRLDVEFRRRRRMVVGNLQWVREILLPQMTVLMMASRRAFRIFWAYWILLILIGVGIEFRAIDWTFPLQTVAVAATVLLIFGLLFSEMARRLCTAFLSGLFVIRHWRNSGDRKQISWN